MKLSKNNVVDLVLVLLFLVCLAGMFVRSSLHQVLGIVLLLLVVFHGWRHRYFFSVRRRRGAGDWAYLLSTVFFAIALLVSLVSGGSMTLRLLSSAD